MGYMEENQNDLKHRQLPVLPEDTMKPEEVKFEVKSYPRRPAKWRNIILLSALHILSIISYIYCLLYEVKFKTIGFVLWLGAMSGLGTSAGSHRLWAHRSYKARWPLRIWLMYLQTITMNGSIYSYARDHRTHHKVSDTEGDPKNPSAGIFYAHIGWWLQKKSDAVKQAGSRLDFSDLKNDPIVWFQHQYYTPLFIIFGVLIPWLIPVYFWNEDPFIAFGTCVVLRITIILHHIFTVNSIAHFIGNRPYDFRIWPADHRLTNYLSFGEGIHNYHHVFPYDYRINERPQWEMFNPITAFIDFHKIFGLAYDCKTASSTTVEEMMKKRGVIALRDQKRPLAVRIFNAVLDWLIGLTIILWMIWPGMLFKYLTGRNIFVFS